MITKEDIANIIKGKTGNKNHNQHNNKDSDNNNNNNQQNNHNTDNNNDTNNINKENQKESSEKPPSSADEIKTLKIRLAEMTGLVQRNQAEFDNFRKRIEREKIAIIKTASKNLIYKLLPLLDNFELALKNTDSPDEFIKGTELIFVQLFQTLEDAGLKSIECTGKQYDPYLHEALLSENHKDKKNELILEELQKGYTLGDTLIRHSKVKINKIEDKK